MRLDSDLAKEPAAMPEISVIITTHNRPYTLRRAIESARAASKRDTEIVVVDDASMEDTARVCHSIPGINYMRTECNKGVASARNIGILASHGDFLSFLDDDDLRLPGSLDLQLDALTAAPKAGLIYGQAILGRQDGTVSDDFYPIRCPSGDVFWELLAQNFVPCGASLFRRSCLSQVGLLDDKIAGIDDWDLWVRIAEHYPVLALEQPVMIWRKSTPASGQGSSNAVEMVKLSARQFKRRWMLLPRALKSPARKRRKSSRTFSNNMASHLLWEAVRSIASGHLLRSHTNFLAALRLSPAAVTRVLIRPASFHFLLTRAPKELQSLKDTVRRSSELGSAHRS
jgi:glycosyltransferase involved in cell wall biosynthesis